MAGLNKAILIGNLGQDPEIRYTQNSQAVLKLRLATTESFVRKGGEREERTEWHTIIIWGNRAEALNKFLTKGARICVEGRIQYRQWEDKEGHKRNSTEINATNIVLLGGSRSSGGGGGDYNQGGGSGGGGYNQGGGSAGGSDGGSDFPSDDFGDDDIPF